MFLRRRRKQLLVNHIHPSQPPFLRAMPACAEPSRGSPEERKGARTPEAVAVVGEGGGTPYGEGRQPG